jgi:nicotinate phosphoribosyltransferase
MEHGSALATDLYELTMMAGYFVAGMNQRASFELYTREMPPHRGYLVAAGLEQALGYLEGLSFTRDEIAYLRALPAFRHVPAAFFDECLPGFRFAGDVWAVEEGTPICPHEPILRVTAPLQQAQLVETALLAIVTFQTSIASKAARVVEAAAGRPVIEFGGRRAHGLEAGTLAARAAYLAGCGGTSNVDAGFRFGIPVSGTMAHSWLMAFDDEMEAFRRYAALYGERTVFLIDTYDVMRAARRIAASDLTPAAVRLDSGDVSADSRAIRQMLDRAGKQATGIFVSGDLDEYKIAALVADAVPISGWGVGTALSTSKDAPALGGVYKLVEIEQDGRAVARVKHSVGKASYAGCKQVWRRADGGRAQGDLLGAVEEEQAGVPLLQAVMKGGRRVRPARPIAELRAECLRQVGALPEGVRRLEDPEVYPVTVTERLRTVTGEALSAIEAK